MAAIFRQTCSSGSVFVPRRDRRAHPTLAVKVLNRSAFLRRMTKTAMQRGEIPGNPAGAPLFSGGSVTAWQIHWRVSEFPAPACPRRSAQVRQRCRGIQKEELSDQGQRKAASVSLLRRSHHFERTISWQFEGRRGRTGLLATRLQTIALTPSFDSLDRPPPAFSGKRFAYFGKSEFRAEALPQRPACRGWLAIRFRIARNVT